MDHKKIMAIFLFLGLSLVALSGCVGQQAAWSFTINGDPSMAVNASLYRELNNSSTEVDGATGIPLELFLYHYGVYPVTGVSYGGAAYNWTAVMESADKDEYALVEPNGSIFYNGTSSRIDNMNVTTAAIPAVSTLDIEPSVLYALNAGGRDDLIHQKANRAVIFYVDALGYSRYMDAKSRGLVNNISSIGEPIEAVSVYPSVTQTNAKAMVTGQAPDLVRGDFRSYLPYNDTMLDILDRQGMHAVWVDGNSAPVKLNDTVLNVDRNGDGSQDDEAIDAAISEYAAGENLVVVHFKDTDTIMHRYGPYSPEGLASVKRADALIGKMLPVLDNGTLVIVWADHGCHAVPGGGNHGTLIPDDMYISIIIGRE